MKINIDINNKEQAEDLIKQLSELTFKKEPVKRWEDLKRVEGWIIPTYACIEGYEGRCVSVNKNTFATEKQALSSLAAAQLSQLMKDVNGDWVADWVFINKNTTNKKHYLYRFMGEIAIEWGYKNYHFLSFPTEEIRDTFLKNHKELIEQYFEL